MFEGTDSVLNTELVPSNISYKSFKTWNLYIENSYCDHRTFGRVNQANNNPYAGDGAWLIMLMHLEQLPIPSVMIM